LNYTRAGELILRFLRRLPQCRGAYNAGP